MSRTVEVCTVRALYPYGWYLRHGSGLKISACADLCRTVYVFKAPETICTIFDESGKASDAFLRRFGFSQITTTFINKA